jgi:predicted O-methyltransferase YrrM
VTNTLHDPRVAAALDRMFASAAQDEAASQRLGPAADFAAMTAQEKAAATALDDVITLLEGDARETLAGLGVSPGLVLLDGWKDLCLPVLHLLEPGLAPGTLVVADDTGLDSMQPYLKYVRAPGSGYENITFPIEDGMEISCLT